MRKILLITALLITFICQAQEALFTIISFKGTVTLDGNPITCGQKIDTSSHALTVSQKGDYVSVLTSHGYAFQLGSGEHKIKNIALSKVSNLQRVKSLNGIGAVHRAQEQEIKVLEIPHFDYYFLGGDSLTIIWNMQQEKNTYSVRLMSLLEEILLDSTITDYATTISVEQLFQKERALMFQVKTNKHESRHQMVKLLAEPERTKFSVDAGCIPVTDFVEHELLMAGLCEIYNLYYDQIHHVYNLFRYSQKTSVTITHPYYKRMFAEHGIKDFLTSLN